MRNLTFNLFRKSRTIDFDDFPSRLQVPFIWLSCCCRIKAKGMMEVSLQMLNKAGNGKLDASTKGDRSPEVRLLTLMNIY